MLFQSTRRPQQRVTLSAALAQGLAPDGGLYVPAEWPRLAPQSDPDDLPSLALELLSPFAAGDALAAELPQITREAFDFPAPLSMLDEGEHLGVLELFHGPTAAFKDFGARFLAAALARRGAAGAAGAAGGATSAPALTILVATSGDTGGAVAAAFHRRAGIEVAVLFPKGLVSPMQQQQLTCWGDNIRSFAVRGRFDDCQRLVKEAFADRALQAHRRLSSANSINLGRLLPQMVYYWAASLKIQRTHGQPASFAIPSGNLGNATACVWARKLGAPIDAILLAHNANRTVPDYLDSGELRVRASVATLSSAMDVGNPSNLERLTALYHEAAALRTALTAMSIDDDATRARIRTDYERYGRVWCPHTAVAAEAYARLPAQTRARARWVLVATAHPAKFREFIEPLIGRALDLPPNLARLFERPASCTEIDATLEALKHSL
ncbi:MAG TPA: threonine synthase [Steroidobacteraceae bacterium]|jgi:threonine synthase|nr:threonine synthase [Steroidobacteraceae bacterium]